MSQAIDFDKPLSRHAISGFASYLGAVATIVGIGWFLFKPVLKDQIREIIEEESFASRSQVEDVISENKALRKKVDKLSYDTVRVNESLKNINDTLKQQNGLIIDLLKERRLQ